MSLIKYNTFPFDFVKWRRLPNDQALALEPFLLFPETTGKERRRQFKDESITRWGTPFKYGIGRQDLCESKILITICSMLK